MATRARRARPGHARRARAREGREDSHLALVWGVGFFQTLTACASFNDLVTSDQLVRQLIWHGGSRQQVTWSSQGEVPAVRICLHKHATDEFGMRDHVKTLEHGANNSGSHEVLVPDGLTPGQYVVRIHPNPYPSTSPEPSF